MTFRQNIQVFKLYRRCLRELTNNVDRETLSSEARKVRFEFETYRGEADQGKVQFLLDRANYWLDQIRHSEPYVIPNHPGGVAYLRNPELDHYLIKKQSDMTDHPEKYSAHH